MRSLKKYRLSLAALLIGVVIAAIMPKLILHKEAAISERAERVFYRGEGSLEWGTVCALNGGYVSVHHVTKNGVPRLGPRIPVTAMSEPSDWSFLGLDPATLDPADFPALEPGATVSIHGFPARDRDGEVIPGRVYIPDTVPPFVWVELLDAAQGIAAEGVIGGISGSCVFDDAGQLVAVVHANGFSEISGTTNTWALVIPLRAAVQEAQGTSPTARSSFLGKAMPSLSTGRWAFSHSQKDIALDE